MNVKLLPRYGDADTALRDFCTSMFSVPLADGVSTAFLAKMSDDQRVRHLEQWLRQVESTGAIDIADLRMTPPWLLLELRSPHAATLACHLVDSWEVMTEVEATPAGDIDFAVHFLCIDISVAESREVHAFVERTAGSTTLVVDPAWAAAIIVQQSRPLMYAWEGSKATATPYFDPPTEGNGVAVQRSNRRLKSLLGQVQGEQNELGQRVTALEEEPPCTSSIQLCTTYLPGVFESPSATRRYYRNFADGSVADSAISRKLSLERERWMQHIEKFVRVDVIDRSTLEEYLAAPEYYQMRLTHEEALEQVDAVETLLQAPNYKLCLSPEAIDLAFEIREGQVTIRTDRRNKSGARSGRLKSIVLRDAAVVETFAREFWALYNATEPAFLDSASIVAWMRRRIDATFSSRPSFDAALWGNPLDDAWLLRLAGALTQAGARCWRADLDALPGRPWVRTLETLIGQVRFIVARESDVVATSSRGGGKTLEQFVQRGAYLVLIADVHGERDVKPELFASALRPPTSDASDVAQFVLGLLQGT